MPPALSFLQHCLSVPWDSRGAQMAGLRVFVTAVLLDPPVVTQRPSFHLALVHLHSPYWYVLGLRIFRLVGCSVPSRASRKSVPCCLCHTLAGGVSAGAELPRHHATFLNPAGKGAGSLPALTHSAPATSAFRFLLWGSSGPLWGSHSVPFSSSFNLRVSGRLGGDRGRGQMGRRAEHSCIVSKAGLGPTVF